MPQIKELEHIIGEWVCVKSPSMGEICGTLQFVGTNDFFPEWGLNCTISRMPGIKINSIVDIKLHQPKKVFK